MRGRELEMDNWIEDPVLMLRMRLARRGEILVGDVEIQPGGGIGKHFHPSQVERWTVCDGRVQFRLAGRRLTPAIEEEVTVHAGVRHALRNVGNSTARLQFTADPALELEPFLIEAAALNRTGKVTGFGMPTNVDALLAGAALIERYRETCVLLFPPPFPPPALQPFLFSPLARLARRRRRRVAVPR
jgi:quercetin dioxygenase-like cupin family protein